MEGRFLLYVSKKERILDEVLADLKRFDMDLEIPETFCGNLDDPEFVEPFNHEREHRSGYSRTEWWRQQLKKAEEAQKSESDINDIKKRIKEEEAYDNALKNNDIVGWLTCRGDYIVRDEKIYTTHNYFVRGFIEEICEETTESLTDIWGEQVESCLGQFLDYDALNEIDNIFHIVYEDREDAIYCEDDYVVLFEERYREHNATIPPKSFVRIVQYMAED